MGGAFRGERDGCRVPGWRGGMRRTHRGPALTVSSGIFLTVARVLLSHVSMMIDAVLAATVRARCNHSHLNTGADAMPYSGGGPTETLNLHGS